MRPHTLRPVSMQQHPSQTHNDVEIYDSQGRPQSRVQRKPPPAFLASPNRTPPGTATMGNFPSPSHPPSASGGVGGAYTHLRPGIAGVPQHPSLQKYNPEPLAYTARNVDQNTESVYRPPGRWARRDLPVSTPSTDDISSITHLGSGGSDYHQQQQQHHQQGLGPSANTSQSPLSPLPGSTPPQQHQSQKHPYQHRHQQSTSSREGEVHTHPADITGDSDYANAYGGIEDKANASENAATAAANRDQRPRQPLPPPPPEYTDSSGGLSYLTTPALSAHKVPTSQWLIPQHDASWSVGLLSVQHFFPYQFSRVTTHPSTNHTNPMIRNEIDDTITHRLDFFYMVIYD